MKKIDFTVKIQGNTIEIIPSEPIKDNSLYQISMTDIKAKVEGKQLDELKTKIYTRLSPSYCPLESVMSLIDGIDIAKERVLYYIKDASQYADYISKSTFNEEKVPYNVVQFVKFRAAHDALLKLYIERASGAGFSGSMGEIQFDASDNTDAIKKLLDYLKAEATKWEEQVMSEDYTRGVAPKAATFRNGSYSKPPISGYNRGPFG